MAESLDEAPLLGGGGGYGATDATRRHAGAPGGHGASDDDDDDEHDGAATLFGEHVTGGAGGAARLPDAPFAFKAYILLLISLVCFGSYFALDSVQSLQTTFQNELSMTTSQFQLLYSVYSLPNIVLPFFGGLLADRLGLRLASALLATVVTLGTALVALAPLPVFGLAHGTVFILMAVGRTIFGMGAESLNVTQIAMTTVWFREGKALAMAFALVLSMSRLGDYIAISFLAQITTAITGDLSTGYPVALWIATALCALSLLAVLVYCASDAFAAKRYYRETPQLDKFSLRSFTAVFSFELRFWLVCALVLTYYSGVFPFVGMLSGWLHDKYGYDDATAANLSGVVVLASMILSPFLGKAVDVIGRRPLVAIAGSFIILPAHAVLAFTGPDSYWTVYPLWPIAAVGLSFSLVPSALWPCVPLVVPPKYNAFSFGVMTAIQNMGLALVNYLIGLARQTPSIGNKGAMILFVGIDALGVLLGVILLLVDLRRGGALAAVRGNAKKPPAPEQTRSPTYDNPYASPAPTAGGKAASSGRHSVNAPYHAIEDDDDERNVYE